MEPSIALLYKALVCFTCYLELRFALWPIASTRLSDIGVFVAGTLNQFVAARARYGRDSSRAADTRHAVDTALCGAALHKYLVPNRVKTAQCSNSTWPHCIDVVVTTIASPKAIVSSVITTIQLQCSSDCGLPCNNDTERNGNFTGIEQPTLPACFPLRF